MYRRTPPALPLAPARACPPRVYSPRAGFTLVELLVVVGIIGVLIAILLPALSASLISTRNARMAFEIAQLRDAVGAYRHHLGDYPPSMGEDYSMANRYSTKCERHLQRCFPRMTRMAKDAFYDNVAPNLDQGEALVFFLSQVSSDPTNPFNPTGPRITFYDFKPHQLTSFGNPSTPDNDSLPSYRGAYSKESSYIYVDSRTYALHAYRMMNDRPARAENSGGQELQVRPYYNAMGGFMAPTAYQILCAGQDGEFSPSSGPGSTPKVFPSGAGYAPTGEDNDNLTSFSEGRTLGAAIPQ